MSCCRWRGNCCLEGPLDSESGREIALKLFQSHLQRKRSAGHCPALFAVEPRSCYNLIEHSHRRRWTLVGEATTLDDVLCASEQLSPVDQLRLISLASERLRSAMDENGERVDMLSLAGLGAELWREVDVADYLEQERASWER